MPIGTMTFPVPTMEQSNPLLAGFDYMSKIRQNYASAAQQQALAAQEQLKAQLAPQTMAEQLKQSQAKTIEDQATAKYADPMEQAKLQTQQQQPGLVKAQTGYYGSEGDKATADAKKTMALLPGDVASSNLKIKYPGMAVGGAAAQADTARYLDDLKKNGASIQDIANASAALRQSNQQGMQQQQQATPSNVSSVASPLAQKTIASVLGNQQVPTQGLNLPQSSQAISTLQSIFGGQQQPQQVGQQQVPQPQMAQPQQQNAITAALGGQQQQQPMDYGDAIRQSLNADLQQKIARANYFNVSPGIRAATNANLLSTAANNPDVARGMLQTLMNQVAPGTKITDDNVKDFMSYASDKSLKNTSTNTILNQQHYAALASSALDEANQHFPAFASYAGLLGKGDLTYDKIKSALGGKDDPRFIEYNNFVESASMSAADIRRSLGTQATDSEREYLTELTQPSAWYKGKDVVTGQWNTLMSLYKNKLEPTMAKSISQTRQGLATSAYTPQAMPSTSAGANALQQTLQSSGANAPQPQQSMTRNVGGKNYIKQNGKWYEQ